MIEISSLKEKVNNAQMVLIGVGEEFDGKKYLQQKPRYLQIEEEVKEKEKWMWILPYVQNYFLKNEKELMLAFQKLKVLLDGKNYFIVSTCRNGLLKSAGFNEERLVSPCGGFEKMQCSQPDCEYLNETPKDVFVQIEEYIQGERSLSQMEVEVCPMCASALQFNSLYAEHYKEAGYLDKWKRYTQWLQGTLNRRLCILELGVSLVFPSVIRFPFEKIAFFNQMAEFIRVHEKLYQLSEELGGRGISQMQNAVEFLNRL